jgi:hypothetical protein
VGYALGAQLDREVGTLGKVFAFLTPVAVVLGAILVYRSVKADRLRAESESRAPQGDGQRGGTGGGGTAAAG